jgi:hypothetical protein
MINYSVLRIWYSTKFANVHIYNICFASPINYRVPRTPRITVRRSRICAAGACALSRWRARTRWQPKRCRSSGTPHLEAHSGRDTASVACMHWYGTGCARANSSVRVYLSVNYRQIKRAASRMLKLKQSEVAVFLPN